MKTKLSLPTGSIATSLALASAIFALGLACANAQPTNDPLLSWNDAAAKQAIVQFVAKTTRASSPDFVPAADRIATFDQDGTLWVEHPIYSQVMYCVERLPALVKEKPELAHVAPFSTVLDLLHGDRAAMEKLNMEDLRPEQRLRRYQHEEGLESYLRL